MAITINGSANTVAGLAAGGLPDNSVDGGNLAMGSDAAGDILYYNGTDYIRLAKGTDGQVLTLASGVPTWAAATAADNTPAFSATLGSDVDLADNTVATVVFNAEQFDTDSAYNTSTGLFTVPSGEGGKYQVNAQVGFDDIDSGGTERAEIYIVIDGAASQAADGTGRYQQSQATFAGVAGQIAAPNYVATVLLTAGQTVGIQAYHTNGATLHLQHNFSWFQMFKLAGV